MHQIKIFYVSSQLAFANEIKTALYTDDLQKKEGERSALDKFGLYLKRTLIWVFVAGVIGGFGYGVYLLYELGLENDSNDDCGSLDSLNVGKIVRTFFTSFPCIFCITCICFQIVPLSMWNAN